ncbi:MAG: hypothetical protein ACRDSK_12685 [Actinophytocola sp.]|uniref:hypothetical protein n=1 Tax=Actinophytocola sp. TaxID=1872138 RepID=UPI003D6C54B9
MSPESAGARPGGSPNLGGAPGALPGTAPESAGARPYVGGAQPGMPGSPNAGGARPGGPFPGGPPSPAGLLGPAVSEAARGGFPGGPADGQLGAGAFPGPLDSAGYLPAPPRGGNLPPPASSGVYPAVIAPPGAGPNLPSAQLSPPNALLNPAGGRPMPPPGGPPTAPVGSSQRMEISPSAGGGVPAQPVGAGETMHTVLIGLPVGGYLPLWHNNSVSYWRMTDPDGVRSRLALGIESRAEIDNARFREAALFTPDRNTLFLMDRYRNGTGNLGGASTQLVPASEDEAFRAVDDKAISDLYTWIGDIVVAAGQRGEYVAIETGGWNVPVAPVVLIMLRNDGREWHSVVETSPVPAGAPVWRDQQPVDGDTQLLASPANERTMRAAGLLTRFAVATWPMHPFQLGLSFGPNPTLGDVANR